MFSSRCLGGVLMLGLTAAVELVCPPAHATVVTLADSFIQLDNSGSNDIGFAVGNYIFIGADTNPGFAGPDTTVIASTIDTVTGMLRLFRVPFDGSLSAKNFYGTSIIDQPGLHGT